LDISIGAFNLFMSNMAVVVICLTIAATIIVKHINIGR